MGQVSGLPNAMDVGAISVVANMSAASSANKANATATATLTPPTGGTQYVTGFQVTATGATAANAVDVTLTGVAGGTQHFSFAFPAGVAVQAAPLTVQFTPALPASSQNQAIAVVLPASGSGGANAAVSAQGFWL